MTARGTTARGGTVTRLVVAVAATLSLAGCAGDAPPGSTSDAEIADGPDCLADEVLTQVMMGSPTSTGRTAPASGKVPEGFEPVAVVECRGEVTIMDEGAPWLEIERLDPETLAEGAVGVDELLPEEGAVPERTAPSDPLPMTVTIVQVTRTGDLGPLLKAMARRSDPVPADLACPAMWESKPQLYLVDAAGRAVRPQWPVTACGFLHDGAAEALWAIPETDSTAFTVEVTLG